MKPITRVVTRIEDLAGKTIERTVICTDDKLGIAFTDGSIAILVGDAREDRVGVDLQDGRVQLGDEYALGLMDDDTRARYEAEVEAERRRVEVRERAELDRLRKKYGS
jgi:hypothetical protein